MTEPRYLLIKALPLEVLSSTGGSVVPEGKTERRTFAGFKLVIENPVGTVREGVDETGKPWRTEFQHAYGEIVGSLGVDGDPVDVYLGDDEAATEVYIVRQMKRKDWEKFDEDKCFIGFSSMEAAKQAYLNHYDDPRFFGGIIAMPIDEFRVKVRATKDNPTMLKTLILFTKAHIAGHTRTLKSGKVVRVNAYDNKVVGRGKPGAPGQADLFGGDQHVMPKKEAIAEHERLVGVLQSPSHADDEVEAKKQEAELGEMKRPAKPEKDWRDEENWHSRTMGRMKTLDEASLRYVVKDATEAAENLERDGSTSKKAGQYRDEAHYASMELKRRRDAAAKPAPKPASNAKTMMAGLKSAVAHIKKQGNMDLEALTYGVNTFGLGDMPQEMAMDVKRAVSLINHMHHTGRLSGTDRLKIRDHLRGKAVLDMVVQVADRLKSVADPLDAVREYFQTADDVQPMRKALRIVGLRRIG